MNLRFVEAYYWVVTLRSVSRAAEKLFVTQSAMSSRVAAIEEELGVLLLDRRDKQFRLTVAGTRFYQYAQRLLELQREIKNEMGSGTPMPTSLRLGVIESVLHSWLIPWIEALRGEHPALELELTVETTPVLVEQIRRGALDLIFAATPATAEGVRSKAIAPMEMVFAGSSNHHKRRRYALADFAEMEVLTFQRGSQPHVTLLDLFRGERLVPRRIHTISSISAMLQLVQGGFGVATLPRAAVARLSSVAQVKTLATDAALAPLPVHASYRSDPATGAVEPLMRSAIDFATADAVVSGKARQTALRSSKKSMS